MKIRPYVLTNICILLGNTAKHNTYILSYFAHSFGQVQLILDLIVPSFFFDLTAKLRESDHFLSSFYCLSNFLPFRHPLMQYF